MVEEINTEELLAELYRVLREADEILARINKKLDIEEGK